LQRSTRVAPLKVRKRVITISLCMAPSDNPCTHNSGICSKVGGGPSMIVIFFHGFPLEVSLQIITSLFDIFPSSPQPGFKALDWERDDQTRRPLNGREHPLHSDRIPGVPCEGNWHALVLLRMKSCRSRFDHGEKQRSRLLPLGGWLEAASSHPLIPTGHGGRRPPVTRTAIRREDFKSENFLYRPQHRTCDVILTNTEITDE